MIESSIPRMMKLFFTIIIFIIFCFGTTFAQTASLVEDGTIEPLEITYPGMRIKADIDNINQCQIKITSDGTTYEVIYTTTLMAFIALSDRFYDISTATVSTSMPGNIVTLQFTQVSDPSITWTYQLRLLSACDYMALKEPDRLCVNGSVCRPSSYSPPTVGYCECNHYANLGLNGVFSVESNCDIATRVLEINNETPILPNVFDPLTNRIILLNNQRFKLTFTDTTFFDDFEWQFQDVTIFPTPTSFLYVDPASSVGLSYFFNPISTEPFNPTSYNTILTFYKSSQIVLKISIPIQFISPCRYVWQTSPNCGPELAEILNCDISAQSCPPIQPSCQDYTATVVSGPIYSNTNSITIEATYSTLPTSSPPQISIEQLITDQVNSRELITKIPTGRINVVLAPDPFQYTINLADIPLPPGQWRFHITYPDDSEINGCVFTTNTITVEESINGCHGLQDNFQVDTIEPIYPNSDRFMLKITPTAAAGNSVLYHERYPVLLNGIMGRGETVPKTIFLYHHGVKIAGNDGVNPPSKQLAFSISNSDRQFIQYDDMYRFTMFLSFYKLTTGYTSITKTDIVTVGNTPSSFRTPSIDIKDGSYTLDPKIGRGEITFSFKADVIGIYTASIVDSNGFIIVPPTNEQDMPWYCNLGSDSKAARIVYGYGQAQLWVKSTPTEDLKCTLSIATSTYDSKQNVELQIVASDLTSKKTYKFDYTPETPKSSSVFLAQVAKASLNEIQIQINTIFPEGTENALTADSTIVYEFSSQVPLDKWDSSSECSGAGVTVRANNILTLSNFKKGSDDKFPGSVQCSIILKGSLIFNHEEWKGASVKATANDKVLTTVDFINHKVQSKAELLVFGRPKIDHDSTLLKEEGGNWVITDTFEIQDDSDWAVPSKDVVLAFATNVASAQVSQEDFIQHMKCDLDGTELKLSFDDKVLIWTYSIASVAEGKVDYKLILKCTRTSPKLTKWGLTLANPTTSSLQVAVVGLYKKFAFHEAYGSGKELEVKQPDQRPQGAENPPATQNYATISTTLTIPTDKDYSLADMTNWSKNWKSTSKDIIEKSTKDDYTIEESQFSSWSFTTSSFGYIRYTDPESTPRWKTIIEKALEVPTGSVVGGLELGNIEKRGIEWRDADIDSQSARLITFAQSFKLNPKDGDKTPPISVGAEGLRSQITKKVQVPVAFNTDSSTGQYPGVVGTNQWVTPVAACGYATGAQLIGVDSKTTWTEWSVLKTAIVTHNLCQIDQACTINADCAQQFHQYGVVVCESKKCVFKAKQAPLFSVSNSSILSSLSFILVVVFGALLC